MVGYIRIYMKGSQLVSFEAFDIYNVSHDTDVQSLYTDSLLYNIIILTYLTVDTPLIRP